MASEILAKRNEENYRNLKNNVSNFYAKEIREGRWMFNGDTIRFDWNGNLIDGQHRLEAIKETNIAQDCIFVEGLNPECAQTIDIGYKRSVEDYLKKFTEMYENGSTAVVKLSMTLKRKNKQVGHSTTNSQISNTMIVDKYMEDKDHYRESTVFGREISKISKKVLKQSHVGGIYYYLVFDNGVDKGLVKEFFYNLASYNTTVSSIYTNTYERLADKDGKFGRSGVDIINTYIKCWNCKLHGCTKQLRDYSDWFEMPKNSKKENNKEVIEEPIYTE